MKTAVDFLHSEYNRILGSVLVTPQQIIEMSDALENAKEIEKEQKGYSEEDMKQFGLYLGDNLKKLKGKSIDELFTNFKQQEQ
jgi:hypothetical protein